MTYHVKHLKATDGVELAAAMEAAIATIIADGGSFVEHSTNSSSTYEVYIVYTKPE